MKDKEYIEPKDVKIIFGTVLSNSHLHIGDKEIPASSITVHVGQDNKYKTKVIIELDAIAFTKEIETFFKKEDIKVIVYNKRNATTKRSPKTKSPTTL